jgi:flagella basal body P-ring formation protein FlgA
MLKNCFLGAVLLLVNMSILAKEDFFDKTVMDLLNEKINNSAIEIDLQFDSSSKVTQLRTQESSIKDISLGAFDPKNMTFRVNIKYNNGRMDNISGKYISFVKVPIAARYIKLGDVLQASDLSFIKMNLKDLPNDLTTRESEVIGMQAKQYIPAGTAIKTSDLVSPLVIKNNDPVNIVYSSGTIDLKTVGTAVGSGAIGDMIKVKNSTSGIVVLGQIINKNTVQVGSDK